MCGLVYVFLTCVSVCPGVCVITCVSVCPGVCVATFVSEVVKTLLRRREKQAVTLAVLRQLLTAQHEA